jgi:hypothetical protein
VLPDSAAAESVLPDSAAAESELADPPAVESEFTGPETAEFEPVESGPVESGLIESGSGPDGAAPASADSLSFESEASDGGDTVVETRVVDAVLAEPEVPAEEPDEAVVVAQHLGSVVGEDVDPDPAEFAAAAVLDVLRAAGWADAAEAAELRAEATRLRELLAEVIRDHRAREASAAGGQNQQLYGLVPLLRAAHGVAFGSLGAKVALRTAVQEVPPDVLALAGLRIDYGVEPAYED